MTLKKYHQYHVNFESKWISTCGALMGLSFFLRIVYYFGLMSLRDVNIIELLTSAFIGIALCGAFVVYLTVMRRNAPGLYALGGVAMCALLIILSFTTGSALRIILSIIWYALSAWILLITIRGNLPGRLLAALMFWVAGFVRLFFFDLGKIGLIKWFLELAILSTLVALGCLAMGMKSVKNK